jgi:hypothetical protein
VALSAVAVFCLAALHRSLGDILDWLTATKDGFSTSVGDDSDVSKTKNTRNRISCLDPFSLVFTLFCGPAGEVLAQKTSIQNISDEERAGIDDDRRRLKIPNLACACSFFSAGCASILSSRTEVGETDHRFKENKWQGHISPMDNVALCICSPWNLICKPISSWMKEKTECRTESGRNYRSASASELVNNPASETDNDKLFKIPDEI